MSEVRGVYWFEARQQWWIHVVHAAVDGTRTEVRQRSPINSQPAAIKHRNKVIAALENGTWQKRAGVPPLEEAGAEFLSHLRALGRKESTIEWYKDQLERVLYPTFKTTLIDRIVGPPLTGWINSITDKQEAGTTNCALRALRATLRYAWERGLLKDRPLVKMRSRTTEKKFRFLSFEEANAVIQNAGEWAALVTVAIRAGLRIGELIGLKWEDFDGKKLHIQRSVYRNRETLPKGGRDRTVPLSAQAVAALKAHRHLRGPYIFCKEDGTRLDRKDVRRPLSRVAQRAGLKPFGPHVMRHTFGSHCAMLGYSLREIQDFMGHASIVTTEIYAHLMPAKHNRLDALDAGVQS